MPVVIAGSRLSVAQQQFVEIARGVSANADVVILDEPTAALNAADVDVLRRHDTPCIRRLPLQGSRSKGIRAIKIIRQAVA